MIIEFFQILFFKKLFNSEQKNSSSSFFEFINIFLFFKETMYLKIPSFNPIL